MPAKNKNNRGSISFILLIVAVVLVVVTVGVFLALKFTPLGAIKKPAQTSTTTEPPKPVYEANISDVRFIFESAQDLGNVLAPQQQFFQSQNLTTTEKFIKVTIGAQNKGKFNTVQGSWDVGNIIDDTGRNFVTINDQAYGSLPQQNLCGGLLKPEFEPVPCIKIYEVSKESTKLKVEVSFTPSGGKKQSAFLDLIVK